MTPPDFADAPAAFLRRLSRALAPLPPAESAAIIVEIESHIAERRAASPADEAQILAGLGDPTALGRAFTAQHRAGRAPAGDRLGAALAAAAGKTPRALAGAGAATLALFALGFALVAVAKPFLPDQVGLWTGPDGVSFGVLANPGPIAAERLGPWVTPLASALAAACGLAAATLTRAMRWGGAG